jgi:hypothetical protein
MTGNNHSDSSQVPGATTETKAMLLDDQKRRWLQGERVLVEEYCQQIPSLRNDVESLLDLIYGEVLLREQCGEQPKLAEYVGRFPHVADQLRVQFELDKAMHSWGANTERTGSPIGPRVRCGSPDPSPVRRGSPDPSPVRRGSPDPSPVRRGSPDPAESDDRRSPRHFGRPSVGACAGSGDPRTAVMGKLAMRIAIC